MEWTTSVPFVILLALGYYTRLVAGFHLGFNKQQENLQEAPYLDKNSFRDFQYPINQRKLQDEQLEEAIRTLRNILILPWPNGESPFIYIENPKKPLDQDFFKLPLTEEDENNNDDIPADNELNPVPSKRMRYYRKYPWKRENMGYDPENPFVCYPSKTEIHRLLFALHDTRFNGFKNPPVDFCNRKRPAHTILTNMHFGGK